MGLFFFFFVSLALAQQLSCQQNLTELIHPFLIEDAALQETIGHLMTLLEACPQLENVYEAASVADFFNNSCINGYLVQINDLDAKSLDVLLKLQTFLTQEIDLPDECSSVVAHNLHYVEHLAFQTAGGCVHDLCTQFMDNVERTALARLAAACSDPQGGFACEQAYHGEMLRFGEDFQRSYVRNMLRELIRTHQCYHSNASASCGINRVVVAEYWFAFNHSVNFTHLAETAEDVRAVAANWTQAMNRVTPRNDQQLLVYRKNHLRFGLEAMRAHVQKIVQNCTGPCLTLADRDLTLIASLLPLTARWIPSPLALAGIVVSALLFLAGGGILVWVVVAAARGSHRYYLLLNIGITVTAALRVCFWTIGLLGFGAALDDVVFSEVAFYVVDKVASLVFALTMLLFLHMWLKAVHAEIHPSKTLVRLLPLLLIALALALTVASLVITVKYAQTHTLYNLDTYQERDIVELLLATLVLVTGAVLLAYVVMVFSFLRRAHDSMAGRGWQNRQTQLSMWIVLSFTLVLTVVFLVRAIFVYLAAFDSQRVFYGFSIHYGVGTLAVEVIASVLVYLVVFTRLMASSAAAAKDRSAATKPLMENIPDIYADI